MLGSIKHVNFEHVLFHPSGNPAPSPESPEDIRSYKATSRGWSYYGSGITRSYDYW